MAKKQIDLSGIDFSDLNLEGVDLGKKPKLPYRTHEWSSLVQAQKRLRRWEVLREVELKRLALIDAEIAKLQKAVERLEKEEKEKKEKKENTEFLDDSSQSAV